MSEKRTPWLRRFFRWLFGGMFQQLPAPFGNPVPPDLQQFEADAEHARHAGFGRVSGPEVTHHARTHPARQDSSLERQ